MMTANLIRAKIHAEIDRLDEHELEDLYRVIHDYRLGTHAVTVQNAVQATTEPQKILKQVLQRMQSYLLKNGAPHLSRDQLHERR
ncbi:MAG: hypothetical protein NT075_26765 [Chloroflexi bacterium]|nr:hypothetical protein [Chloroflexota bacterium]